MVVIVGTKKALFFLFFVFITAPQLYARESQSVEAFFETQNLKITDYRLKSLALLHFSDLSKDITRGSGVYVDSVVALSDQCRKRVSIADLQTLLSAYTDAYQFASHLHGYAECDIELQAGGI